MGCTAGPPTGFSAGDHWTVPLVGPLEEGLLVVPVFVNGAGPYLFALDPDANVSIVDEHVVKQAHLRVGQGPHMLDETDTSHPHFYAELLGVEIGTLSVDKKSAVVVKDGTYDADGRTIDGVLGRDVIADSLVFGVDRDLGVMTLTTKKAYRPTRPGLKLDTLPSTIQNIEVAPTPRRLVKATINGQTFVMHVDLGAKASQLRERSWDKAGIVAAEVRGATIDETGTTREFARAGKATITLGEATTKDVTIVPYADKRWPDEDLEGTLGLDFFRPYSVVVDWDASSLVMTPRRETPNAIATRIGRWQSRTLSGCKNVGCVAVSVVDPLANVPADKRPAQHPGVVASFVRDETSAGLLLEVTVAAMSAQGTPLPWLVANLTGNAERAMIHLPAEYAGATLKVVDASEFPRSCPNGAPSCVDKIAPPQGMASVASQPPSAPAPAPAPEPAPAPASTSAPAPTSTPAP